MIDNGKGFIYFLFYREQEQTDKVEQKDGNDGPESSGSKQEGYDYVFLNSNITLKKN